MKNTNKMLIEANLSSLPMTLTSWSLDSHFVSRSHYSIKRWGSKMCCLISNAGNKLYKKFGFKSLQGRCGHHDSCSPENFSGE